MATLRVSFGGTFNFDDVSRVTSIGALTANTTTFSFTTGLDRIAGTGTGLTNSGGNLTGGTINTLNYYGSEGSLLYSITGLSISAASLQSAADSAYAGNFVPIIAIWATQTWDATGNHRDETLWGGALADTLRGGWGNDFFIGYAGADTFDGGPLSGSLILTNDSGSDFDAANYKNEGGGAGIAADMRLATSQVKDTFGSFDTLRSVEHIIGTNLADTYRGSDLDIYEAFSGGNGVDTANGGGGFNDEIRFDRDGIQGININLTTGAVTDAFGNAETAVNFERVRGTAYNDVINGNNLGNSIRGYAGSDTINGSSGYDTIVYYYDKDVTNSSGVYGTRNIRVDLQSGVALDGWHNQDTLVLIENVWASDFDDRILGNASNNELLLYDGDDFADGRLGNDRLYGHGGMDVLVGGDGLDYIDGGNSADLIYGGNGNDTIVGGRGFDTIVFNTAIGTDRDTIVDFFAADDTFQLDNAIFTAVGVDGALGAAAFFAGTAATSASHRIIYNQATGALFYDADGNGLGATQVQFATLQNKVMISAADFTII